MKRMWFKKKISKKELEYQRQLELEKLRMQKMERMDKEIKITANAMRVNQNTLLNVLQRLEKLEKKETEDEVLKDIGRMFG